MSCAAALIEQTRFAIKVGYGLAADFVDAVRDAGLFGELADQLVLVT